MEKIASTLIDLINTPWGLMLLFIHSFMESSFLPGAHDFVLIAVSLINPKRIFLFALISTLGSVSGASTAYFVGYKLGNSLINKILPEAIVKKIELTYQKFGLWAIAIAGFTPVPFKVFAITSGIFEIKFIPFIIISLIARAGRFFTVATLVFFIGDKVKEHALKSFNIMSIIIIILIGIFYIIIKKYKRKKQGA